MPQRQFLADASMTAFFAYSRYSEFLDQNCLLSSNQGSAFGSGRPEPDRAQPDFRAAGVGLGLEITGLTGLGLEVCGLNLTHWFQNQ